MSRFRRVLRFSAAALAGLVVVSGAAFGIVQTGWGKARLAGIASSLASSDGLSVRIDKIEGFVPSDMRISRIEASDKNGTFAIVSGAHLAWSPLALLSGEVSVSSVGAKAVSVLRSPELPPSEDKSGGGSLPAIRIVVDELSLPRIELGEALLGAPAELSLSGAAALREPSQGMSANLDLRRLDADGTVSARFSYVPTTDVLDVDVTAREGEGGLVARALKLDGFPAVDLRIAGKAPLDAFRADIEAAIAQRSVVSGVITANKVDGQHDVVGDLRADIAHLLPADFAPLAAGISDLKADLRVADDFSTAIRALTMRTAAAGLSVAGDVSAAQNKVRLGGKLKVADPSVFSTLAPQVSWTDLGADIRVEGELARPSLRLSLAADDLVAAGRTFGRLDMTADASVGEAGALSAKLDGQSRENGQDVFVLRGDVARDADGGFSARDLVLSAFGANARVNGRVDAQAADLTAVLTADLAALDQRLEGKAEGQARFSGSLEKLGVRANVHVADGKAMGETIQNLALELVARDLTGLVAVDADLSGFVAGRPVEGKAVMTTPDHANRQLDDLTVTVGTAQIRGKAHMPSGLPVSGTMHVNAPDLSELSAFALKKLGGRLNADIVLSDENGVQAVAIKAEADDLAADDTQVKKARASMRLLDPAKLADISGTAEVSGIKAGSNVVEKANLTAQNAPGGTDIRLTAKAQGADISAAALLQAQQNDRVVTLNALNIVKQGTRIALREPSEIRLDDNGVSLAGLNLTTGSGRVGIRGRAGSQLDLDIDIAALPLSLASLADPSLVLGGTLSGQAKVAGSAQAPEGSYKLQIARLSETALARSGIGPLDITAQGQLAQGRAGVDVSVSGPSLSGVSLRGSVPVAAGMMDLAAKGTVGLGLANPMLAASGARLAGSAVIDAKIGGTFAAPLVGGTVRIENGKFDDTANGIAIEGITALVRGDGKSVRLSNLNARTRDGGTIDGDGSVAIDPARGFPGAVSINFTNATLVQNEFMRFVSNGRFTLEGALATSPRIAGRMDVRTLDFIIPERMPGGVDALDVRHVNAKGRPGKKAKGQPGKAGTSAFNAELDLVVSAPNNVFVRGMGMESELGGELRISGTSRDPRPFGGFEMRRGRFDVMGKRLDFAQGRVNFSGTLDPSLDFVAQTVANDITAKILVGGTASAPEISFASSPSLPQDEVIARMMFGRSSAQLTAGQALQVAQTIMQFSGGGPGVMDNIRQSLGVDSLDIGTGEGGKGGQIGIGKRLNDRIYFGVKQGTTPDSTKATIDIDITRNIRVQGAANPQGGSEVGIGAQWDY